MQPSHKKVFVDDQGNVSTVEAPEGASVVIDSPHGPTYEKELSGEDFKKMESLAKRGDKLPKSEVSKIKEEHLARERGKSR